MWLNIYGSSKMFHWRPVRYALPIQGQQWKTGLGLGLIASQCSSLDLSNSTLKQFYYWIKYIYFQFLMVIKITTKIIKVKGDAYGLVSGLIWGNRDLHSLCWQKLYSCTVLFLFRKERPPEVVRGSWDCAESGFSSLWRLHKGSWKQRGGHGAGVSLLLLFLKNKVDASLSQNTVTFRVC